MIIQKENIQKTHHDNSCNAALSLVSSVPQVTRLCQTMLNYCTATPQ